MLSADARDNRIASGVEHHFISKFSIEDLLFVAFVTSYGEPVLEVENKSDCDYEIYFHDCKTSVAYCCYVSAGHSQGYRFMHVKDLKNPRSWFDGVEKLTPTVMALRKLRAAKT